MRGRKCRSSYRPAAALGGSRELSSLTSQVRFLKPQTIRRVCRALEATVVVGVRTSPAIILTGPQRAGKTSLLRLLRPQADFYRTWR